jgi:hypothetical protein
MIVNSYNENARTTIDSLWKYQLSIKLFVIEYLTKSIVMKIGCIPILTKFYFCQFTTVEKSKKRTNNL